MAEMMLSDTHAAIVFYAKVCDVCFDVDPLKHTQVIYIKAKQKSIKIYVCI